METSPRPQVTVEFPDSKPFLAAGESTAIPVDVYLEIVPPAIEARRSMPKDQ